jgi:hypothetical protein
MTGNVPARRPSSVTPTPAQVEKILTSPQLVVELLKCRTIEETAFRSGTKITDRHREMLRQEAEAIECFSADRRQANVVAAVSLLLATFPHRDLSEQAASLKLKAYEMALEDVPTWCVEEAAKRWIRGDVGDERFAPTPPQLRHAARNIALIAFGKAALMRKLASLPVERDLTEEERAATVERVTNIIKWNEGKPRTPSQEAAE